VGRTDSGVWVDLSELHQSLGMFGSRLDRVWGRLGLVGPWLGLVAPRLGRLDPGWTVAAPGSGRPRAGLCQFVTSLAADWPRLGGPGDVGPQVVGTPEHRFGQTPVGDEGRTRHATGPT
jgi:hypothetical protein